MDDIVKNNINVLLILCTTLYVALRIVAWHNTVLLEDHDSTFYLKSIIAYHSFNWQKINELSAYSTPLYPFLSAIIAKVGLSIEASARLYSFLFSFLLLGAFYGIASKITGNIEIIAGLLILSVSPALLSVSYAILTEPSYIATIYLGLFVFLRNLKTQTIAEGSLLGFVFGLAFLNRTEGILFILIIPLMQALYLLFFKGRDFPVRHYLKWCAAYGLAFMLLATPQIWHVSEKMGAFSINGRIAWQLLENSDVGQSGNEKQYGLHFRNDETNIAFARRNYIEAKRLLEDSESQNPVTNYLDRTVNNAQVMAQIIAGTHLGKIGSILALIGIVVLYHSGRKAEVLLITGFAASNLVGPLIHADDVYGRHLLAAVPALILFQAAGTVYVARKINIVTKVQSFNLITIVSVILLASMLYAVKPLYHAILKPPVANYGYGIDELKKPLEIIREIRTSEPYRKPVIAARNNYLAYYSDPITYSDSNNLYLPYAGYEDLVKYLRINNADFLYLRHSNISGYPFMEVFERGLYSPQFELLFNGKDAYGGKTELYRIINNDITK